MNWNVLYKKIGKQNLNKMQHTDVVVKIDDKEIQVALKFKTDGSPYFIPIKK